MSSTWRHNSFKIDGKCKMKLKMNCNGFKWCKMRRKTNSSTGREQSNNTGTLSYLPYQSTRSTFLIYLLSPASLPEDHSLHFFLYLFFKSHPMLFFDNSYFLFFMKHFPSCCTRWHKFLTAFFDEFCILTHSYVLHYTTLHYTTLYCCSMSSFINYF